VTGGGAIALVAGGAGGLGRAVSGRLRAQGVRVAAVSRTAERLQGLAVDAAILADVSTAAGAAAAMDACRAQLGPPELLVNCAGSILLAPAHRTSEAQWRATLAANLDSAFFLLQAWAAARLAEKQPGAAVFVSTVAARIGVANHEAIAAAKGGLEALVRSAAATYAPQGLRFNAVAPGLMDTPLAAGLLRSDAMREASAKQYPLGGLGHADELASLIVWLLGPDAARVTGQTWSLDGGFASIRPLVK
jgi:NAD(P)-dependent dehydrogenase (short-subunit alcohol dehydrogenase family)